jgi:glycosyltransferase involved in cell wall biosynthesis
VKPPTVSILISNHDYAGYLAQAIDSALDPSLSPTEVIVVDDGSTDDSRSILEGYGERITAVCQENRGQAAAINSGFAASRGEIVCILDADDRFMPGKVDRIVSIFSQQPAPGWVFHPLRPIDADGRVIPGKRRRRPSRRVDVRRAIRRKFSLRLSVPSGMCFDRSVLGRILPMPEADSVLLSDRYLKYSALSLAAGYYCDEQLADQRFHGSNSYVGNPDILKKKGAIRIMTAHEMKQRIPQARRFHNYAFAEGWGLRLDYGRYCDELDRVIDAYLKQCSPLERIELRGLLIFHRARRRLSSRKRAAGGGA